MATAIEYEKMHLEIEAKTPKVSKAGNVRVSFRLPVVRWNELQELIKSDETYYTKMSEILYEGVNHVLDKHQDIVSPKPITEKVNYRTITKEEVLTLLKHEKRMMHANEITKALDPTPGRRAIIYTLDRLVEEGKLKCHGYQKATVVYNYPYGEVYQKRKVKFYSLNILNLTDDDIIDIPLVKPIELTSAEIRVYKYLQKQKGIPVTLLDMINDDNLKIRKGSRGTELLEKKLKTLINLQLIMIINSNNKECYIITEHNLIVKKKTY